MSLFSSIASAQPRSTIKVHRPLGGIADYRELQDGVSRVIVSAFPVTAIKDLDPAQASMAASYILASHDMAYFGETGNLYQRLMKHASSPSKSFAREVYVISGHGFDKTKAIYLQYRLTKIAEEAGHVHVVKGVNPQVLDLPDCDRAPLDLFVEHSDRLLFDAGCRALRSPFASQRRTPQAGTEASPETDDNAPIEIGVISTPPLGSELELSYSGLWARGYPAQDGFIVMAGSELRSAVNPSAPPILSSRRADLTAADALATIPGVSDRLRLRVAVWFPSRAIAAKVLCGAKDASTWDLPGYPQPIVIITA
jgi:predicted GIY-YIG superfamily endonuclease